MSDEKTVDAAPSNDGTFEMECETEFVAIRNAASPLLMKPGGGLRVALAAIEFAIQVMEPAPAPTRLMLMNRIVAERDKLMRDIQTAMLPEHPTKQ